MASKTNSDLMTVTSTLSGVAGFIFLIQLVYQFIFYNVQANIYYLGIGWFMLIMGYWAVAKSIVSLKSSGGIEKHESIRNTDTLVATGLYGLIRHPMYFGFIIFSLALSLIAQHWISIICSFLIIPIIILLIISEDRLNSAKFGQEYTEYQNQVPRINIILGVARFLRGKRRK